jgi:hypothetical protein
MDPAASEDVCMCDGDKSVIGKDMDPEGWHSRGPGAIALGRAS